MELQEQIKVAVDLVSDMFKGQVPNIPQRPPEDATLESLWEEIVRLRKELDALKKIKRGVRPKVEGAVKLLLEDDRLAEISVPLIADIIRKVFNRFDTKCECSESSVRWYMSQRNLQWNIVRRRLPKPQIEIEGAEEEKADEEGAQNS